MEWMCAPLVGVSQIFVVNDALSGAAILAAIALYSPQCAAHTLMGSAVGMGTALACGAPAAEIGMGLWGFNSALTALAVSVFFVPGDHHTLTLTLTLTRTLTRLLCAR